MEGKEKWSTVIRKGGKGGQRRFMMLLVTIPGVRGGGMRHCVRGVQLDEYGSGLVPAGAGRGVPPWGTSVPGFKVSNTKIPTAAVLTLFGKYYGTIKRDSFFWTNPFCACHPLGSGAR